jgi:hypothetical protein
MMVPYRDTQRHTHIHIYIYIYIYIYMYIGVRGGVCVCGCVWVCIGCASFRRYIRITYAYVFVCMRIYAYVCVNTRMYAYICVAYTYMHWGLKRWGCQGQGITTRYKEIFFFDLRFLFFSSLGFAILCVGGSRYGCVCVGARV